jgi:hypothetical protein
MNPNIEKIEKLEKLIDPCISEVISAFKPPRLARPFRITLLKACRFVCNSMTNHP